MTTDSPTGTDLVFAQASLKDRLDWARAISGAGALVPSGFRDGNNPNPAKILLAVEYGAMLGLHPMAALSGLHIIDGKPTLSAALMSAQAHKAGHQLRVTTSGKVTGTGNTLDGDFEVTATLVRRDDPQHPFVATWTIDRAKRAGLWGVGNWKKYPENQMTWRAVSEAVRTGAPEVLLGVWYTPDELGATVDEDGSVIDAEIVESEPEQGIVGSARGLANETEVSTRPNREHSAPADTRPRSSRTKAEPGAGRTVPAQTAAESRASAEFEARIGAELEDNRKAIADEWATRARNALTVTDARDLYRDAKHRGILDYPTTSGELLEDVLRARGEHLADEEAQAAAGEPADEDVPLELPF